MPMLSNRLSLLAGYRQAGGGFDPEQLAALTNWWTVEDLATVGDGNPASSWTSRVGGIALANTGTGRPTYEANDGDGKASLLFDGVDDSLFLQVSNAALLGTTGDYEWWFVYRAVDSVESGLFCCTDINNQNGTVVRPTNLTMSAPLGAQNITVSCSPLGNVWRIIRCAKEGARRIVELDGVSIYDASTSAGTYGTGNDILKMGDYFSQYLNGALRHALFFNDVLGTDEALELYDYLEAWT